MDSQQTSNDSSLKNYLILAIGVIALSFAGPLVKKTEEAMPFALGFIRLAISSLLVMPFGRPWEIRQPRKFIYWAMLSGVCFFIHLTTWFLALRLVSIAIATTMLALLPVVVMVYEYLFFRKKPLPMQLLGIGVCLVGTFTIVFNSINKPTHLLGIFYMVIALATGALYLMTSVKAQEKLNTWQTVSIMYPVTCICFGLAVLITGTPIFGLAGTTYAWIASVALIPTFFGHTLLNISCKSLSPVIATTATLVQPFIAGVIAWFWLGQSVTVFAAVGAVIIITGIFITLSATRKPQACPA